MLDKVKDFFKDLFCAIYGTFVTDAEHRYDKEVEENHYDNA